MKEASHTKSSRTSSLRLVPEFGLVDVSDPGLSERLAGKVTEQLEVFASRMRQGLLAASVAIGLDVMGELVDAEVAEVAGPKGKHDSDRSAYDIEIRYPGAAAERTMRLFTFCTSDGNTASCDE